MRVQGAEMRHQTVLLALLLGCTGDKADTGPTDTGEPVSIDADGDGVVEPLDCDDNDPTAYPGAPESCDGVDNNCDGITDEGFDEDADGVRSCDGDCDDNNPDAYPDAEEVPYDGIDQDCDGADANDLDGDGVVGTAGGGTDCDDADPAVYPGAEEVPYDGIDQDCLNGDLTDVDGDGVDAEEVGGQDCDDTDPRSYGGNTAVDLRGDGVDVDCDGADGTTYDLSEAPAQISGDTITLTGRYLAACDLDDDGLDDLVVSAPFASGSGGAYAGMVLVYYGANAATWDNKMDIYDADVTLQGEGSVYAQFFGFGVACGDLNGDGISDLAIGRGEISYASVYVSEYDVSIFYGGALPANAYDTDADAVLRYPLGVLAEEPSVREIAMWAGDLDGDGMHELMLNMSQGLYLEDENRYDQQYADGTVWIVSPGDVRKPQSMTDYVTSRITPDSPDAVLHAAAVPDISGDGQPELLLGQGNYYQDKTAQYDGLLTIIDDVTSSGEAGALALGSYLGADDDGFGYRSIVEDLDGDGLLDLLTTAIDGGSSTITEGGRLYLISDVATALTGTREDPLADAAATILGQQSYGSLGAEMSLATDIDADGTPEVFVMEPGAGSRSVGRVLMLGGGTLSGTDVAPDDIALLEWENTDTTMQLAAQVSGDFDGDGTTDLVVSALNPDNTNYSGAVYIYLSATIGL